MNTVKLSLPARPEYLITVRLVASSVAGRAGFDIEKIDEIKTAVAEACLLLIPNMDENQIISLEFITGNDFKVIISGLKTIRAELTPEQEIGKYILEALVDNFIEQTYEDTKVYELIKKI